ncbi:OprO/OprP family phosphate-selective porin [Ferrimonas lipolytica]|uniref:Carbohydrate porin n=1 Tax=Ferrimonas lipolytica TaxID=2724191 RepID=A0A6H1UEB1_9GAMM|nr:porin [Ferrimonas lipolytica]QIZ77447.1 carbohydrate porin [Ferrimonas lipolytica]
MARYKISSIALAVSFAVSGFASNVMASDSDKLLELEQRMEALEIELIEARDAAKKTDRLKFKKTSPSPELISKDGRTTMEFKARIQADYVDADAMQTGKKAADTEAMKDTNIRRLRLGLEGQFARDWEYEIELDFADSEVDVKDAKVAFNGWQDQKLILGFQKYGFGLANTQSSAHQIMMERPSVDVFSADRALGVQWRYVGNNWNLALGMGLDYSETDESITEVETTELLDEDGNPIEVVTEVGLDEESIYGESTFYTARATYTPIKNNDNLLHLGASYMLMDLDEGSQETRYRARSASKPVGRMVDTGNFASDGSQTYGVEAMYQHRNMLLRGEYMASTADQFDEDDGSSLEDVEVDAFYVTASYILTGEQWRYSGKKGVLKSPRPASALSDGGWGAWEIAARYEQANFLEDHMKYGGDLDTWVVGVNWYMEDNLKMQFNYIDAEADNKVKDDYSSQDTNIVQARLHFAF